MGEKTNKELAVEAACEYIKSWNSCDKTKPADVKSFIDVMNAMYDAISALDKR